MREEARHLITKNVNSISLIRIEEEENGENKGQIDKSVTEPRKSDKEKPLREFSQKVKLKGRLVTSQTKVYGKMSQRMKRMSHQEFLVPMM
ncbi:hypothetical protein Tco_0351136 [Tanacetum coccineum]